MDEFDRRVHRAVQSILENESLTADLDDPAAQVLLDWGIACAEGIAGDSVGLDDDEARDFISSRLRATRRLMRRVRRWVIKQAEMDAGARAALLDQIMEQAAVVYRDFAPPDDDRRAAFLRRSLAPAVHAPQMIAHLRALVEGSDDYSTTNWGGTNG